MCCKSWTASATGPRRCWVDSSPCSSDSRVRPSIYLGAVMSESGDQSTDLVRRVQEEAGTLNVEKFLETVITQKPREDRELPKPGRLQYVSVEEDQSPNECSVIEPHRDLRAWKLLGARPKKSRACIH